MRLSYVTFIARDVAAICRFYVDGMGLAEVLASRDERYREVTGGGCMVGFATAAVRPALNLPEEGPSGTRAIVTFDVGAEAALDGAVARAIGAGASLVREAVATPFGQRQAVLRDPEDNIFRLSAAIGA